MAARPYAPTMPDRFAAQIQSFHLNQISGSSAVTTTKAKA
jgi:hypothetical protein